MRVIATEYRIQPRASSEAISRIVGDASVPRLWAHNPSDEKGIFRAPTQKTSQCQV